MSRISTLELNRASLARQLLLEPADLPLEDAVSALGALQAQEYTAPPVALWSRLVAFEPQDFLSALQDFRLIYATLLRGTLHVVSAPDYPYHAAIGQDRWLSALQSAAHQTDVLRIRAELHDFCAQRRSRQEVIAFIEAKATSGEIASGDVADLRGSHNWRAFTSDPLLVRVPADDDWRERRPDGYVVAFSVLPALQLPAFADALRALVRQYLFAFGPAGVDDICGWTGQQRVKPVRQALADLDAEIVDLEDANGRVIFDLTGSPRPGPDMEAPVRFLSRFDSLLLAYAPRWRDRVLPRPYADSVIIRANAQVLATYLVDGFVAGLWSVQAQRQAAMLTLSPFHPASAAAHKALLERAECLVRFVEPGRRDYVVRLNE
jgi:hypothetical protein